MDTFEKCREICELLECDKESLAREQLILLLDYIEQTEGSYTPLINHLIRKVGLYPYIKPETSRWDDRFVFESFKVDVGDKQSALHREQSSILKRLVKGESLVVSAPTSFGKSFIIDAFISLKQPSNVVIIVPTIALTDETRRRLYKKFGSAYRFITTSDAEVGARNIFIFPQERAIHYVDKIERVDILIIDEFYKAGATYDKERSPALIKALLKFQDKASQRYYLAPNISRLDDSLFTQGMEFVPVDFSTVFLQKHELYHQIGKDEARKGVEIIRILKEAEGKTLIYAGTYSNIDKVGNLVRENIPVIKSKTLECFSSWLEINYDQTWNLTHLVKRGFGVHNGRLHRSLSQIQVKLFEEPDGLNQIISTSSIIEGVNTSAANVIIWRNRNGTSKLTNFAYRNVIGRGGRMFKHFVGQIYILEAPPEITEDNLELAFPEQLAGESNTEYLHRDLTPEQVARIIAYKEEMIGLIGKETFDELQSQHSISTSDWFQVRDIAKALVNSSSNWNGVGYLNSDNPDEWDRTLYNILGLDPGGWGCEHTKFVGFIKILSNNWSKTIPQLLSDLDEYDIGIDKFFELERLVTMRLGMLLNDFSVLQRHILRDKSHDISSFIVRVANAFLPPVVYDLEEYGLPRMISRKINASKIIDLSSNDKDIHAVISEFQNIGREKLTTAVHGLSAFDAYILDYFYDGITVTRR